MSRTQKDTGKDPHASREANRYENPIASREFILEYIEQAQKPLSLSGLMQGLEIPHDQEEALSRRLGAMVREGQLLQDGKHYMLAQAPLTTVHRVVDFIMAQHQLIDEWPKAVIKELKKLPEEPDCSDLGDRVDLRHLPFVTIDGEDAKDFDDAVYAEKDGKGFKLFVAIADVSHYVKAQTALDHEAQIRGNSIYFPDRVIPMLPEQLSNGLCSLKPSVNRFCLVCEMELDAKGYLKRYRFYEGVIFSAARLTYTNVAKWLGGDLDGAPKKIMPHLKQLYQVYQLLLANREQRGALDIDTVETKVGFNSTGHVTHLYSVQRNDAHRLIEECMLLANVATGDLLLKHKAPAVFRVHEKPDSEKVKTLRGFLSLRGLLLGGGEFPHTREFNEVLKHAKTHADCQVIQVMVLRTMQQAIYSPKNNGHFGLAYEAYTHFTSPIRRYSDLLVHREIKRILLKSEPFYSESTLSSICQQISDTERKADEMSRGAMQALKCLYLSQHLGSQFDVVVSGVTAFGMFATIQQFMIDGLIHMRNLRDDFYHFDSTSQMLVGERSGREFHLGQTLKIMIARVDVEQRRIDFELVEENTGGRKPRSSKPIPKKATESKESKKPVQKRRNRRSKK